MQYPTSPILYVVKVRCKRAWMISSESHSKSATESGLDYISSEAVPCALTCRGYFPFSNNLEGGFTEPNLSP